MSSLKENTEQTRFKDARNKLAVILNDIAEIARQRGEMIVSGEEDAGQGGSNKTPNKYSLADILNKRARKVAASAPFRVAVVGEFSRGKSTLVNALLGREVLVSDFRPNTAARTILRYGEPERFRVTFVKGLGKSPIVTETVNLKRELAQFTSDASFSDASANYRTLLKGEQQSLAEQIQEVEVWCISDFLKTREMEVCDTPGLGSVFPAHKAVTYEVIPTVDATLFLVQADPGPGESDILFLRYIREYVGQIFFVLTKKDMARSPEELEGMLEFVRATIESQAELHVENLYAVSALQALQGNFETSGFPEFLLALESFLIRASGVARLQTPYDTARNYWSHIFNLVENDIKALDIDLNTLRVELERLQRDKEKISNLRNKLLKFIDDQIKEMTDDGVSGVEDLPANIRQSVEATIDKLDSLAKLNKAGDYIQPVIKEVSVNWLTRKEDRFRSRAQRLSARVEESMKEILDTIQQLESALDYGLRMEVKAPTTTDKLYGDIKWNSAFKAVIGGGVGFAAGIGTVGIAAVVLGLGTAIPGALLLLPFVTGLFPMMKEAFGFKEKARKELKAKLLDPIKDNNVNLYQAVVEGYVKPNGERVLGMRQFIERAFRENGDQLKKSISETVTNNLDSRLTQLHRQINEKESGHLNHAIEMQKYAKQKAILLELNQRLDQVAKTITELSNGQIEIIGAQPVEELTQSSGANESENKTSPRQKEKPEPKSKTTAKKPARSGAKKK